MSNSYYKGYWMVTNRCNLRCSYCVLENSLSQLKQELDLEAKKELLSHLYKNLGFRRLTLSGGEVLIIGKKPPEDFLELLNYIRTYRSSDPIKNLEIELYSNGTYLDEKVADAMEGVVDLVAVTIDSPHDYVLTELGRNTRKFKNYYENILQVCQRLAKRGIALKLHSVVGTKSHHALPDVVASIHDSILNAGGKISTWKFYQYMSYDVPERDTLHSISKEVYALFQERVERALEGRQIPLHFKDNEEMNASLFNILSYGNAQYMREGDSWSTSQRTADLRSYPSMADLFAKHDIDEARFRHFHEISR